MPTCGGKCPPGSLQRANRREQRGHLLQYVSLTALDRLFYFTLERRYETSRGRGVVLPAERVAAGRPPSVCGRHHSEMAYPENNLVYIEPYFSVDGPAPFSRIPVYATE